MLIRRQVAPAQLYCSTDADTVELRAHAQDCLEMVGYSRLADTLWKQDRDGGPDSHETLAARLVEISPEELQALVRANDEDASDARQFAKIPGYGFPGGLGAPTFVTYARRQLSREQFLKWFSADREEAVAKSARIRETWFETFPENRDYFRVVGDMIDRDRGYGNIIQRQSARLRGRVRFAAAANGFFQGRVADAMKEALWRLAHECYTGRTVDGKRSPLLGSRPVMFLHDEPILEHPEDGSESERAERQRVIVVESLKMWLPDVPVASTAVLLRRWHKGAKPVKVGGKLVPSRPEKFKNDKGQEVTKWVHDAR